MNYCSKQPTSTTSCTSPSGRSEFLPNTTLVTGVSNLIMIMMVVFNNIVSLYSWIVLSYSILAHDDEGVTADQALLAVQHSVWALTFHNGFLANSSANESIGRGELRSKYADNRLSARLLWLKTLDCRVSFSSPTWWNRLYVKYENFHLIYQNSPEEIKSLICWHPCNFTLPWFGQYHSYNSKHYSIHLFPALSLSLFPFL